MEMGKKAARSAIAQSRQPAIRFLVESALREVIQGKRRSHPRSRGEWVAELAEALMSESEASYTSVITSLMTRGVGREEIQHSYIPAAARYLGELWVSDKASFVDVTVGAGRLQKFFRSQPADGPGAWQDRSIPLGQSVLMVIPRFEDHSLGAFVAADGLRRHGLWVHMGIGLDGEELAQMLMGSRFSMLGLSLATPNSVEKATDLVDFVRSRLDHVPPVVVGGRAVEVIPNVARRTGADHAVRSAGEAVRKCGLSTAERAPGVGNVC